MGKNLIIKGADFHENGIATSVLAIDRSSKISAASFRSNPSLSPFADADYPNLQGKTIVAVEFKPYSAGTISIIKSTALDSGGHQIVATINVASEDIGNITKYPVYINVGSNDIIGFHDVNDTAKFYYAENTNEGMYMKVGSTEEGFSGSTCLCVNWYIENDI